MTTHRLIFSFLLVAAACGDKGTDTNADETSAAQTDTTPAATEGNTTGANEGATSDAPTTGGTTAADTTGGASAVVVEDSRSMCDEGDPEPVVPSFEAKADGPGAITVTHVGVEASCCLALVPSLTVEAMTIDLKYEEEGDPCDCICSYTVETVLSGLTAGTWTVSSGTDSVDVDVQ